MIFIKIVENVQKNAFRVKNSFETFLKTVAAFWFCYETTSLVFLTFGKSE